VQQSTDLPRRRWVEVALVAAALVELVIRLTDPAGDLTLSLHGSSPVSSHLGHDTTQTVRSVIGALLAVALLARHRHWRWLLPAVLVLDILGWSLVVLAVSPFAYANRERRRGRLLTVTALGLLAAILPALFAPGGELRVAELALGVLVALTAAVLGMYARARRELLEELRHRAEQAEHSQASAEESARRAERTRIAREMHDIVAHRISLVALQAGALEVNQNLSTQQVSESAGLIRTTATEALSELREVLGVLRGSDDAPLNPQPRWEDVRELVRSSQDAGITVELFDFIDVPVPDQLARTVFRVVQEGLTNIHKHAQHTSARVALIGAPGSDLIVEISNVLPRGFETTLPGARMGLSGIETRVAHAGGTITSGPTDDGHFEVKAMIPWPQEDT
jgi:signal transduction histidine kinase